MTLFTIDEEKCRRDGICVAVCPARVIELDESSPVPTPATGAQRTCIRCGQCVAVCPHGALSHSLTGPEACPPVEPELALGVEHVEHLLRSRRSIRTYRDKAVEHETLAKLIDIARYAPTGSNSQQIKWVAVNSRAQVLELAGLIIDMMRQMVNDRHPVAPRMWAPFFVNAWDSGTDLIARGAPALVVAYTPEDDFFASVDPVIALSFLDVAAPSLGLGTCWGGYFMAAVQQWAPLRRALGIPDGNLSAAAMMVGYPKYRYHRLPPRKEPPIHWRE